MNTEDVGCRGADSERERKRQLAKLVAALMEIDAAIVGLVELENNASASLASIVGALNADSRPGTYDFVNTGTVGTDAIKVGFIYQSRLVTPLGEPAVLDSPEFVEAGTSEPRNRVPVAQTFKQARSSDRLTVVVNHFKSKGSSGLDCSDPSADPNCDQGDGAGNFDPARTTAAEELAAWLAGLETPGGDPDVLIIGDLNAYASEAPITTLEAAGYTDLLEAFVGPSAYSFLFDSQVGYLDHALASPSLVGQVTGAAVWHTNADEVPLLDYEDTVRDATERSFDRESAANPLYAPNPFRASDHDAVIVGLDLQRPPPPRSPEWP